PWAEGTIGLSARLCLRSAVAGYKPAPQLGRQIENLMNYCLYGILFIRNFTALNLSFDIQSEKHLTNLYI
uniref:hypothetical protein n=1 Tax=Alloprevotella sp. TaxID=1872471 RepID=UPI003FED7B9D